MEKQNKIIAPAPHVTAAAVYPTLIHSNLCNPRYLIELPCAGSVSVWVCTPCGVAVLQTIASVPLSWWSLRPIVVARDVFTL